MNRAVMTNWTNVMRKPLSGSSLEKAPLAHVRKQSSGFQNSLHNCFQSENLKNDVNWWIYLIKSPRFVTNI